MPAKFSYENSIIATGSFACRLRKRDRRFPKLPSIPIPFGSPLGFATFGTLASKANNRYREQSGVNVAPNDKEICGSSGITVGRDRVRQNRTGRFFEYPYLRISFSSLRLSAFASVLLRSLLNGTPRRQDREGNLGAREFAGCSCFSFVCPPFSCPLFHSRNKKTGWQKDRRHL